MSGFLQKLTDFLLNPVEIWWANFGEIWQNSAILLVNSVDLSVSLADFQVPQNFLFLSCPRQVLAEFYRNLLNFSELSENRRDR
jgi:hypothetical protein